MNLAALHRRTGRRSHTSRLVKCSFAPTRDARALFNRPVPETRIHGRYDPKVEVPNWHLKKKGRGGRRYLPYVFTEQGVAILSSVLHSERAVLVNVEIMRAFVRLRQMLASNVELSHRLDELESKYDRQFKVVFDAIRQMTSPAAPSRKEIGCRSRK